MDIARSDAMQGQVTLAVAATGLLFTVMLLGANFGPEGLPIELVVAAVPLTIAVAWLFPAEIALAFVAVTMFRIHEAYPILLPLRVPLATAGLAVVACAMHLAARTVSLPNKPELKLAFLFFAHVTLGVFLGADWVQAIVPWVDNFAKLIVAMVFLSIILRLPRDAIKVAYVLMLGGTLISFVAIYNQLNGLELVEGTRVTIGRSIKSQLGDPNDLCFVLMFPIAFVLGGLATRGIGTITRMACVVSLIFMMWAIIATKSRGGLLSTVVVFGCVYSLLWKARVMPLLLMGAAGALLYVVAGIGARDYVSTGTEGIDAASLGRLEAWKAAFRMAMNYPIFGVGMGNFFYMFFYYTELWDGKPYVTHSIWFQALSETGFVGLGIFIAMFYKATMSAFRSQKRLERSSAPPAVRVLGIALFASWIGILVAGSFLSQVFSWQVFTLVALTAVMAKHVDETYPEAHPEPSTANAAVARGGFGPGEMAVPIPLRAP